MVDRLKALRFKDIEVLCHHGHQEEEGRYTRSRRIVNVVQRRASAERQDSAGSNYSSTEQALPDDVASLPGAGSRIKLPSLAEVIMCLPGVRSE